MNNLQTNLKVIIIEDEKPAARLLERKLKNMGIEISQMLHSVSESIEWLSNNTHPDLIFLDIQLSDGLSFEIFEAVSVKSAIIFTTAYDEYALKAFKFNSIDYLLKPIDDEDLENALVKFKERMPKGNPLEVDFEQIKKMLVNPFERNFKKRFTIKIGMQLKIVEISEIECFFSENKGVYIQTSDNRNYLIDGTLEQLEQELDPNEFYRVNRKFIVSIKAIKEIVLYSNSRLKILLSTFKTEEIIVSREKVSHFKSWIG